MSNKLVELGFKKGKRGYFFLGNAFVHVDGKHVSAYRRGRLVLSGIVEDIDSFLKSAELI